MQTCVGLLHGVLPTVGLRDEPKERLRGRLVFKRVLRRPYINNLNFIYKNCHGELLNLFKRITSVS